MTETLNEDRFADQCAACGAKDNEQGTRLVYALRTRDGEFDLLSWCEPGTGESCWPALAAAGWRVPTDLELDEYGGEQR